MIELTTGIVFLMSSVYGSGQAANHIANIANAQVPANQVAAADDAALTGALASDRKVMEVYIRKEYADRPILIDIARCESNFRQFDGNGDIVRGKANREDVGVMQINEKYQGSTAKLLGMDIYTVEGNIAYGKHLYDEQGSKPWSASKKCWSTGDTVAKK